jgi:osmotically-inducible protein OsmY
VTVAGRVPSTAARERALALARETAGVSQVVDQLQVAP